MKIYRYNDRKRQWKIFFLTVFLAVSMLISPASSIRIYAADSETMSENISDGEYTPEKFTWSGGTGRVQISCDKVVIKDGQAYATLIFSSDHYQYVKVDGDTYYTTKSDGQASVEIPVVLNQNMKIVGMTDKMSSAHEIEYNIYVYLESGKTTDSTQTVNESNGLDEKAPEIMGLKYQSETEVKYAQYFKIYHYEKEITLLEVDVAKDTARDSEKAEEKQDSKKNKETSNKKTSNEKKNTKESASKLTAVDEEVVSDTDKNGVSESELAAKLYKGNIVKYLLVPEKVEIPVGLEQDMIIVRMPKTKAYVASADIQEMMDKLKLSEKVVSSGKVKNLEFKTLVKKRTDLAILPGSVLPKDGKKTSIEKQTEQYENLTEKFAMLGIPVIIDRAADEQKTFAKAEWGKVYGVLLDCEEQANQIFEQTLTKNVDQENK